MPRCTFGAVAAAMIGEWPAEWLFDMSLLGLATESPARTRAQSKAMPDCYRRRAEIVVARARRLAKLAASGPARREQG